MGALSTVAEPGLKFVRDVFSQVPSTYELTNHLLTFGLDMFWRRKAVKVAAAGSGTLWVDMCTGTGETAAYLARRAPKNTRVLAVDISLPMMKVARGKPESHGITFLSSDIGTLPFVDGTFDLITMSFATRNINRSRAVLVRNLREYYRILKPGGRFVSVETSRPGLGVVRGIMKLYVKFFVEVVGTRISGSRKAYAYLAGTIPRFYAPQELADTMREAGFGEVSFQRQLLGVAAIHRALKL